MRIAISGATGLLGGSLARALTSDGHEVLRLTRRPTTATDVAFDPARSRLDEARLDGADVVVHLAGEPIGRRWTAERKRRIRESRVDGTTMLARALAGLSTKPRVLLSGSAVGIYGDRGDETLDESSAPGDDFLARVGVEWEAATAPARDAGIRVAMPRTGIVLSARGGALPRMLTPFRLGVGGRLGSGRQWMSWIALDDWLRAARFLIDRPIDGPVNLVSPAPVTNAGFTEALGSALGRPTPFPVPAAALRLLFGEMADAALLASQRVLPRRLLEAGFTFAHGTLEGALREEVAR